jgi:predicted TPR repeat methyltransferase
MTAPLFQSSGDLIADRRYAFGRGLAERGDLTAAADLFAQAVELAPNFTSAWFALGEARDKLGQTADAVAAFRQAQTLDPQDHRGAGLYLMRLEGSPLREMPPDYVRTLFDQYAPRFDTALVDGLAYRGPELLLRSTMAACAAMSRPLRFDVALDLGCGTGLGGAAFRPFVGTLAGVDISPKMIEQAQTKAIYDHLAVGDIVPYLREQPAQTFDLVFAADVFAYFPDLAPLATASASVLKPSGLFAFSVETHAGDGAALGAKLRYAHGAAHVRAALAQAGMMLLGLDPASTRNEGAKPVAGLIATAMRQ